MMGNIIEVLESGGERTGAYIIFRPGFQSREIQDFSLSIPRMAQSSGSCPWMASTRRNRMQTMWGATRDFEMVIRGCDNNLLLHKPLVMHSGLFVSVSKNF
jgi:hypothetical protein